MHSRYNQQQDPLNQSDQQGQHSHPVRPTNTFTTYQRNQGNSDKGNGHMDMNFRRNQNHACISQQVHHNKGHVPDSSQVKC